MENSQKDAELSKWNSRSKTKEIPLLSCFFFCCSTQSLTAAQWPTRALRRRNKWMESGSDAKEQYGSYWAAGGEAQRQKLSWMENLFAFHLKLIPCDYSCCGRFLAFLRARVLIRSFVSLVGCCGQNIEIYWLWNCHLCGWGRERETGPGRDLRKTTNFVSGTFGF